MSLKTLHNEFYGDETRWWVGIVESVDDPIRQGRVRVRIYGIHSASAEDIPNSALPWAQVVAPVTQGGTSGINGTIPNHAKKHMKNEIDVIQNVRVGIDLKLNKFNFVALRDSVAFITSIFIRTKLSINT